MIVVVKENENGKIELTKEEIEKMVEDAYNEGFEHGMKANKPTLTYPQGIRSVPLPNYEPHYNQETWIKPPEITCK